MAKKKAKVVVTEMKEPWDSWYPPGTVHGQLVRMDGKQPGGSRDTESTHSRGD